MKIVLRHIANFYGNFESLTLKQLTMNLATLMALLTGQSVQTLRMFDISRVEIDESRCVFKIDKLLK